MKVKIRGYTGHIIKIDFVQYRFFDSDRRRECVYKVEIRDSQNNIDYRFHDILSHEIDVLDKENV